VTRAGPENQCFYSTPRQESLTIKNHGPFFKQVSEIAVKNRVASNNINNYYFVF
jgi:hypothetical protein